MTAILQICDKHGVDPAVYLRAFANNTKMLPTMWDVPHVILSEKWPQFIPAALQELETEATVTYENDARAFISSLAIEQDPQAVIDSEGVPLSALGRVSFARKYGLQHSEEKWMKSATKEALANPCLAEVYSFWQ
jgi:hypothetical protein